MIDINEKVFTLGRTKSSPKWHVVIADRTSRCGHQIIGEMITGIPSGKLGTRGELCLKCLGFIMFDAADESERSLDLRRLPPDQRKILARLNR